MVERVLLYYPVPECQQNEFGRSQFLKVSGRVCHSTERER